MRTETKHFIRHYVEMVIAMFVGMAVLYMPAELALNAIGSSWDELSDALMFLGMAATMTVPMVAWMIYRGHGGRADGEMAAAMFLPTFAVDRRAVGRRAHRRRRADGDRARRDAAGDARRDAPAPGRVHRHHAVAA